MPTDDGRNLGSTTFRLFELLLFVLIAGLFLTQVVKGIEVINRLLGIVLVLLAVNSLLNRGGRVPAEVLLLGAFVAWGAATGLLVAGDQEAVLRYVRLLVQELALFFAVAEYARVRRSARAVFIALSLLPLALGAYSYFTGQWQQAVSGNISQMSSLMINPNGVGIGALYGFFGVAYISRRERDMRLVALPLLFIPVIVAVVLLTASRKSLLTITLFSALWAYVSMLVGGALGGRIRTAILVVAVLFGFWYVWTAIVPQTHIGTKFRKTLDNPRIDSDRYSLYEQGWGFVKANPIAGVGLGNFLRATKQREYAHSDYMEPLATTGVVGFVLYMSILLCLFRRLIRISRRQSDPNTRYRAGLYIAILVSTMALGIGVPNFLDPYYWLVLGAAVGHSRALEVAEEEAPCA